MPPIMPPTPLCGSGSKNVLANAGAVDCVARVAIVADRNDNFKISFSSPTPATVAPSATQLKPVGHE